MGGPLKSALSKVFRFLVGIFLAFTHKAVYAAPKKEKETEKHFAEFVFFVSPCWTAGVSITTLQGQYTCHPAGQQI